MKFNDKILNIKIINDENMGLRNKRGMNKYINMYE